MKKVILLAICLSANIALFAQDFPIAWKSKFSFKPDKWYYPGDGKFILGRDETQAEMIDGVTGKQLWKLNFKNDLKVKELARAVYNYENGIVLFYNQDEKKKNGEKITIDFSTGKELWRTDSYAGTDADDYFHFAHCVGDITVKGITLVFNNDTKKFTGIDARSGNKKWESKAYPDTELSKHVIINPIEGSDYAQIMLNNDDVLKIEILYMNILTGELTDSTNFTSKKENYSKSSPNRIVSQQKVGESTIKLTGTMKTISPTKIKFELTSSGETKWSKQFEGEAVRELYSEAPYVKLDVQGDQIFVLSKSITVFDRKTGNQLWQAPFDNCDVSVGLKAKQEFGIAGWPLVYGNYVYYVDLQNDNAIKKVEATTGKLIWKSEKIKSNDRVPNLIVVNNVLVAQFGGMINVQIYIPNQNGGGVTKTENRFDGNYGLKTYDIGTGALIWSSDKLADKLGDKFSNRISTIYGMGSKIVVASDKNVFSLDAKTGELGYKTPLSPSKVGDVVEMLLSEDTKTLNIFCDNGVASVETATGKLNYATKTDELFWKGIRPEYTFQYGKNFFIWVEENTFIGFDLSTGNVKGKMKDNSDPQFTDDGNYLFVRDGDKLTKYSINN